MAEHPVQNLQQRITWLHPAAEFSNGCTAMPNLIAIHEHGAISEAQPLIEKLAPQLGCLTTIHDRQIRNTRCQLTAQREGLTERTFTVVDECECHRRKPNTLRNLTHQRDWNQAQTSA